MPTHDTKTDFKALYGLPSNKVVTVDVPPMQFLMLDGMGNPNTSPEYQDVLQALYSVSYTLKFMLKKSGDDFKVGPLEGLWWADDMDAFLTADKDVWQWTMMIMQPPQVTDDLVRRAVEQAATKKPLPSLKKMRFESFHEGLCAQVMYVGPYAEEGPTIQRLHAYIHDNGYQRRGKHHEIYLGDPRRAAPEKLKTVIRQPLERAPVAQPVV